MRAVPSRLVRRRQQDVAAAFHARHQLFHDPQLRRVHHIVCGIDREEARGDLLEVRRRIVVARRVELIEHVVGVVGGDARPQLSLVPGVGGVTRRSRLVPADRAAGHHHQKIDGADHPGVRWLGVVAVLVRGIARDAVHDHRAHDPVSARNLRRRAGERHEAVDKVRIHLTPGPAVHRPHRGAEHETEVRHLQAVNEHRVLRANHVVVGVLRKARVQTVAWLAGFSVADAVGQDDEIARRIEDLAGAEQFTAEGLRQERRAGAAGAVENHHGVPDDARGISLRSPDRPIVEVEGRQRLAGAEPEIAGDEIAFGRRGKVGGPGRVRDT